MYSVKQPCDLLFDQLLDILSMERQLSEAYPVLADLTKSRELTSLIYEETHLVLRRVDAIERAFERNHMRPSDDPSKGVAGLLAGGEMHLRGVTDRPTRDLMMMAHLLRIQHYGIAAYDISSSLAQMLGRGADAALLDSFNLQYETAVLKIKGMESEIFRNAAR